MSFSGIPFLFYFLPVALFLYFVAPKKLKNTALLLSSLVFYAWGAPKFLPLILGEVALFYGCGLLISKTDSKILKKVWMLASIIVSMALLALYKGYVDFVIQSVNSLFTTELGLLQLGFPIGISFYTFRGISYTVDIYRGKVEAEKNPITFASFLVMFPCFMSGPIVRYTDLADAFQNREQSWENFYLGLRRFLIGLAKNVILAASFYHVGTILKESTDQSVLFYWLYAVAQVLAIYFDCTGYADQAIGLGKVMGFTFVEDFNYPYISTSIQEFWRRWRMSLASWFKDYLYIPLGGNRVSTPRWVLNTLAVWMFTGLWHGASLPFIVWGLMFAILLMFEKWVPAIKKLPTWVRRVYVLLMVTISFVLFSAPDLATAGHYIGSMFGFTGLPLYSNEALFYLGNYAVMLIIGILGVTPIVRNTANRIAATKAGSVLEILVVVLLLLVAVGYLVSGGDIGNLYADF